MLMYSAKDSKIRASKLARRCLGFFVNVFFYFRTTAATDGHIFSMLTHTCVCVLHTDERVYLYYKSR